MLPEKFEKLCSEFMEAEGQLMNWKAGEYSDGEDRLQNFREIANLVDCKKSEVALMYLLKHIQSIKNAVKEDKVKWHWQSTEGEGTKQRVADSRNYLLLLAACISEESEGKNENNMG